MTFIFGTEYFVMKCCFPEYLFPLLIAIPLFFTLFGSLAIHFVYLKPSPSIAIIMGMKMFKILISMMLIILYVILIKDNAASFLFSFLLYFTTYLSFETWMLYSINKKKSAKKNDQL